MWAHVSVLSVGRQLCHDVMGHRLQQTLTSVCKSTITGAVFAVVVIVVVVANKHSVSSNAAIKIFFLSYSYCELQSSKEKKGFDV